MIAAGFGFGGCPMRALTLCAVAALAATAFAFSANAYCRGCVIETQKTDSAAAALALAARAEAPPVTIKASCHVERQKRGARWRTVKVCE
jgi:hypothetical protein